MNFTIPLINSKSKKYLNSRQTITINMEHRMSRRENRYIYLFEKKNNKNNNVT